MDLRAHKQVKRMWSHFFSIEIPYLELEINALTHCIDLNHLTIRNATSKSTVPCGDFPLPLSIAGLMGLIVPIIDLFESGWIEGSLFLSSCDS